jgi:hypothetical protein
MLPILISVSLAPMSYFFCAAAGAASSNPSASSPAVTPIVRFTVMVVLPGEWTGLPFWLMRPPLRTTVLPDFQRRAGSPAGLAAALSAS